MIKFIRAKYRGYLDKKYRKLHMELMNLTVTIKQAEKRRKKVVAQLIVLGILRGKEKKNEAYQALKVPR